MRSLSHILNSLLLLVVTVLLAIAAPVSAKVASSAVTLVSDSYRAAPSLEAKWHQGCGTFKVRSDSGGCVRYYDPQSGQYTQQDPIGLESGTSLLNQYVSNPIQGINPFGLQGVCPKTGTATITKHDPSPNSPLPHYTVKVSKGSTSNHTHQVITGNKSTEIVSAKQYPPSMPVSKSVSVPVPRADKGISYQNSMKSKDLGPYDKRTNGCVTHVCETLRNSGVDIPKGALSEVRFLKSLGLW